MGEASALNYKKNMWVGYVVVAIFGKHNLPHYSVNICWLKDCFVLSTSFSTSLLCHLPITWLGNLIVSVGSQKIESIRYIFIFTLRFVLRTWHTQSWWLASLKFVGEAGRLEIQVTIDVTVLSLKFIGQANRMETQTRTDVVVLALKS